MLCVTGVYLGDITYTIFFNFALECESAEHLLLLFTTCELLHYTVILGGQSVHF